MYHSIATHHLLISIAVHVLFAVERAILEVRSDC